jgi:hypothetical protein
MKNRTDRIVFVSVVLGTMFMGGTDGHTSHDLKRATFNFIGQQAAKLKDSFVVQASEFGKPRSLQTLKVSVVRPNPTFRTTATNMDKERDLGR